MNPVLWSGEVLMIDLDRMKFRRNLEIHHHQKLTQEAELSGLDCGVCG